jgi:hypothetical protein
MKEKGKIISLSATGLDSPGLVAKITTKIFEDCSIYFLSLISPLLNIQWIAYLRHWTA